MSNLTKQTLNMSGKDNIFVLDKVMKAVVCKNNVKLMKQRKENRLPYIISYSTYSL